MVNSADKSLSEYSLDFFNKDFEQEFKKNYIQSSIKPLRAVLYLGVIVYSLFFLNDILLYKPVSKYFLFIRFAIGVPSILFAIAATYKKDYWKYANEINLVVVTVIGLSVVSMAYIGRGHPEINRISTGLAPIFLYMHVCVKLRYKHTLFAGTGILIAQFIVEFFFTHSNPVISISNVNYLIAANFIGILSSYQIEKKSKLEFLLSKRLKEITYHDALTGLKNRFFFQSVTIPMLEKFLDNPGKNNYNRRVHENGIIYYSILLIDIDFFKQINDEFGHNSGDIVLKKFSDILVSLIRWDDIVVRWGGEEFIIILKKTNHEILKKIIRNIGLSISKVKIDLPDDKELSLTCSMGAVTLPFPGENNIDSLIGFADKGLYEAKNSGRNQARIIRFQNKTLYHEPVTW